MKSAQEDTIVIQAHLHVANTLTELGEMGGETMNPFCPKCKTVMMHIVFRTWTDKLTHEQGGAKFWECPVCKYRVKAGKAVIK